MTQKNGSEACIEEAFQALKGKKVGKASSLDDCRLKHLKKDGVSAMKCFVNMLDVYPKSGLVYLGKGKSDNVVIKRVSVY